MSKLESRLAKLEGKAAQEGPAVVVLFGDDPVPDDATERTVILRFEEQDRGL